MANPSEKPQMKNYALVALLAVIATAFAVWYWQQTTDSQIKRLSSEKPSIRQAAQRLLVNRGETAVVPLIELLDHDDYRLAERAQKALAKIGRPALKPLLKALGDDDRIMVRFWATKALGDIKDQRAVGPLIDAFRDKQVLVSTGARAALVGFGSELAGLQLVEALKSDNQDTAINAAETLGHILLAAPPRDHRTVKTRLSSKPIGSVYVRGSQYRKPIKKKDEPSVSALVELLESDASAWWVKLVVAQILGEIGDPRAVDPLIAFLETDIGQANGAKVVQAIMSLGEQAHRPLAGLLKKDVAPTAKIMVISTFQLSEADVAADAMILALKDSDPSVRAHAAEALGDCISEKAAEPLRAALADDSQEVRAKAQYAVKRRKKKRADRALIERLIDDEDTLVRVLSGDLGFSVNLHEFVRNIEYNKRTIRALISGAKKPGFQGRHAAIKGLGASKSELAVPVLLRLAKEGKQFGVREGALRALSENGTKAALIAIIKLSEEAKDADMRSDAKRELWDIGPTRAKRLLSRAVKDKTPGAAAAAETYEKWIQRQVEQLLRGQEIESLGFLKSPKAVKPLIEALSNDQSGVGVRASAAQALGRIGDKRALPALIRAAQDGDTQYSATAQEALIQLGIVPPKYGSWILDYRFDPY